MKHKTPYVVRIVAYSIAFGGLFGCAEYSSRPVRVDEHFGEAVRDMQMAQTYDASKRVKPDPNPVMRRDGIKTDNIINKNYRRDYTDPRVQAPEMPGINVQIGK